jgi:AraC-like DNA-binding protein
MIDSMTGPRRRGVVLPPAVLDQALQLPITRNLLPRSLGFQPHVTRHEIDRPEGLPEYILQYCLRGHGWCRIGGRFRELLPGDAVVIPFQAPHQYGAMEGKAWTSYWTHFRGEKAADYLLAAGITPNDPWFHLEPTIEMIGLLDTIMSLYQSGHARANLVAASTALGHFFALVGISREWKRAMPLSTSENLQRSIEYMQQNVHRVIRLFQLAQVARLSVPHYAALFKDRTGFSPMDYFIRLKIQRACDLLVNSRDGVEQIGHSIGYDNPFYFSRIFKKVMQVSPRKYRQMNS